MFVCSSIIVRHISRKLSLLQIKTLHLMMHLSPPSQTKSYSIALCSCILFTLSDVFGVKQGHNLAIYLYLKQTGRGKQKTQNLKCHTLFPSVRSLHMLYWFMHFLNTQPLRGISAAWDWTWRRAKLRRSKMVVVTKPHKQPVPCTH